MTNGLPGGVSLMSAYEKQVWFSLNAHWQHRDNRRGLPDWLGTAMHRTGQATGTTVNRVIEAVPDRVREPIGRTSKAVRLAMEAVTALLDLTKHRARESNDPNNVEKLARKHGLHINALTVVRHALSCREVYKWYNCQPRPAYRMYLIYVQ